MSKHIGNNNVIWSRDQINFMIDVTTVPVVLMKWRVSSSFHGVFNCLLVSTRVEVPQTCYYTHFCPQAKPIMRAIQCSSVNWALRNGQNPQRTEAIFGQNGEISFWTAIVPLFPSTENDRLWVMSRDKRSKDALKKDLSLLL